MSSFIRRLTPALLLTLVLTITLLLPHPAHAAVWSSSAQYGSWSNGGYTFNNDIWGQGAGPQTIWANSYSNWGVWSNQPNTGEVKSYPHVAKDINTPINSLHSTTSSFNVTVPGSGSYETAYDIWANGSSYEIMLWMNKTGAVGPLGSYQTNVSVGNYNWNVFSGSNGSNAVFSFVNTGYTTSGTVNILSVLKWIEGRHWFGNVTLSNVQFGYEITSSSGGMNFNTNSFSVSYN
jgi:hypothetical protein